MQRRELSSWSIVFSSFFSMSCPLVFNPHQRILNRSTACRDDDIGPPAKTREM